MPNANYRKGSRNEARTRKYLAGQGYVCIRAAGSHGAFDLVALGGEVSQGDIAVQVKSNGWGGKAERRAMETIGNMLAIARVELWRWDDHARKPRIRRWVPARQKWEEA